ncbi:MAG: UDP-glucose dehydrogenase family protein [Chitinophagales bacterium]|nr:UDP-glucose/GDP-mannose dehydrogenase family protein [Sphingobacteriales bacterium]
MNIAVIGTGYVGLVSGVCFAETGVNVICVDNNKEKIEKLNLGEVPIYEPLLDTYLKRNFHEGRIQFTMDLKQAVDKSDIIFLALPTPESEDGSADLSYVLKMAETLSGIIASYKVVVNKSTVPVGTAAMTQKIFDENCKVKVDVVSNPEFLREGFAVEDFLKPDRIVIGSSSERAIELMTRLYKPFVRQGNPIFVMDEKSAELTKYAANSFLALKISFMNEMANLAEKVGADIDSIRRGIGTDNRIGSAFLYAGLGYGGSCFPKDVKALQHISSINQFDFKILNAVIDVNALQKEKFIRTILTNKEVKGKRVALWGLSFKPNTDDIREAPALYVIDKLIEAGASVTAYDPEGMANVKRKIGDKIQYAENMYDALDEADVLVIVTEWPVFRTPDFDKMKSMMHGRTIFDGRNVFDHADMKSSGFDYFSIGRQVIKAER